MQGSNGEYCYLNREERVAMIEKVRQWAAKDKLVLAGSGCESTKDTVEMTAAMANAGVSLILNYYLIVKFSLSNCAFSFKRQTLP